VEHEQGAGTGEGGHGSGNIGCADMRELVDTRRSEKTFESPDAGTDKLRQVFLPLPSRDGSNFHFPHTDLAVSDAAHLVSWNHATPEANISPTLTLCRLALDFEVLDGGRGRKRVKRHVDKGGYAT
jgi:hypothetical protein